MVIMHTKVVRTSSTQQQIKIQTNCAAMKAMQSKKPGRSTKDQLLDRVTKMSA